jgi:hypothetical protein
MCFQILTLLFAAFFCGESFAARWFLLQRVICLRGPRRPELCTSLSRANLKWKNLAGSLRAANLSKFFAYGRGFNRQTGENVHMDALGKVKAWIGGLTVIGLMLLALAIVAALLVGSNLPFFGNVTGNIMALVKSLGDAGLVGLIALGVILWLFSSRKMA